MLHLETIEPETLSILRRLQELPELKDFFLVGGTALALKYGHRISIDLDLFSHVDFKKEVILNALVSAFQNDFVYEETRTNWGIFGFIKDIKVDIVKYDHPIIAEIEIIEGIRMYHDEDLIAMKFNAVLGRGKKKDFFDISELSHYYTLNQMIDYHRKKYPSQMLLISIPTALTYFVDAEESEDAISLKGQTWEAIKDNIKGKVKAYLS